LQTDNQVSVLTLLCVTDEMDHGASVPAVRPLAVASGASDEESADDNEIESPAENSADDLLLLPHNMLPIDDVSDKSPGLTLITSLPLSLSFLSIAKRLAVKSIPEMACIVSSGTFYSVTTVIAVLQLSKF